MALVLKSQKQVDMIADQKAKGGGGVPYFKPAPNEKGVFKVFICPPKDEDTPIIQKVVTHEIFNSRGKLGGCVSPANFEEKDPFVKLGWALKKKYADHKNEKVKNFFKYLVGQTKNIIYVIDPSDIEKGVQVYQAPKPVVDFIQNDIENNDGDMGFCHPETGRCLIIKKSGKGLATKYACGWAKNDVNLDGIDEDKLEEMLGALPKSLLGTMFKKPTKDDIEDYKEVIDGLAEKLKIAINWKSTKDSNLEVDDDADLDGDTNLGDDDDDLGDDDNGTDDDDLDLEEDEPKDKKKAADKKAPANDKKKTETKNSGKKAADKKQVIDDEDDLDLDEDENSSSDDLDLEEDE